MPALDGLRIRGCRRIPLAQIEAIVAARLGPGRVPGNAQPPAFSRQVAMYLASRVGNRRSHGSHRCFEGDNLVTRSKQAPQSHRNTTFFVEIVLACDRNISVSQRSTGRVDPVLSAYLAAKLLP